MEKSIESKLQKVGTIMEEVRRELAELKLRYQEEREAAELKSYAEGVEAERTSKFHERLEKGD